MNLILSTGTPNGRTSEQNVVEKLFSKILQGIASLLRRTFGSRSFAYLIGAALICLVSCAPSFFKIFR
ncbi:hypothetical protein BC830DRAFT_1126498 [Chytriomyces sp. MP71]|nr:hypothetical protein BC830DRAFT_1126498 [Chytriomyces sp. MP71]